MKGRAAGPVLILGNGISRLAFNREVLDWRGELWGCNRVYREYGEILDRLTGHKEVVEEARKIRDEKGWKFELWTGHLGRCESADQMFTCPREFWKDSGTTLVAQALYEGRRVELAGFDLGGPDIHSPGLEKQDKMVWILRWRALDKRFGLNRVKFWGYDHKSYIQSSISPQEYAKLYLSGKPHVPTADYVERWESHTGLKGAIYASEHEMVVVRVQQGPDAGKELQFRRDVARKFESKGVVKILEGRRPA